MAIKNGSQGNIQPVNNSNKWLNGSIDTAIIHYLCKLKKVALKVTNLINSL